MTDRELKQALRRLRLEAAAAQALSGEMPVLDDAAKQRIMAQCNEKMALGTYAQRKDGASVSGVGQLTRKQNFRPLLTAAACLLVVCGIGAAVFLHRNTPPVRPVPSVTEIPTITETTESTAPETTSVTETVITHDATNPTEALTEQNETEAPTERVTETMITHDATNPTEALTEQNETEAPAEQMAENSAYAELVKELTAQYEDLLDIVTFGTSYDESDTIAFSVFPSEESLSYVYESEGFDYNQEYQNTLDYYASVDYGRYCRNTDDRFDNLAAIEEYAKSIVSERLFNEMFRSRLMDGLTAYSAGDSVSSDSITNFTMRDGTLYVHAYERTQGNLFNHWTDTPITITDVTENSFIAEREWSDCAPEYLDSLSEEELKMMEYHIYQYLFVKDAATGEWRIDQQIYLS